MEDNQANDSEQSHPSGLRIVAGVASAAGASTANGVSDRKYSFSRQHLAAARLFAGKARKIEERPEGADDSCHRAYVAGSIIMATAFLEASINEVFLEAVDRSLEGVDQAAQQKLAEWWRKKHRKRRSILQQNVSQFHQRMLLGK